MTAFLNFSRPSGRLPAKKKAARPEATAKEDQMLQVAEKPAKAKLFKKEASQFIAVSPEKRAADWLDDQIEKSAGKVTTQIVELTPALAHALLNRNPDNRKVSDHVVDAYTRDIANGAWLFNGEPIIVSSSGELNDGQHRSEAVLRAGVSIKVVLIIGVERETRMTLDQGKVRTVADFLGMNGHTSTTQLAATVGYIWQHQNIGRLSGSGRDKPTKSEALQFIREHTDIASSVDFVQRKGADAFGGRTILAFVHWTIWHRTTRLDADNFVLGLIDGTANIQPINYVHNRLAIERGRLRPNDKAELMFRAWNAWRRNETYVRSLPVLGGLLPTLEA